jgi:sugar phosphate isomerase/epimerase
MFRLIAEVLNEYGILFGVEFIGPTHILRAKKYPFIHTIDKMLELCDAVGTGNAGLLLDSHHCYCSGLEGGEFAKFIRNERDIVVVHINDVAAGAVADDVRDSPRFYPGEPGGGGNDLRGFMDALKDLNYTGPIAVEPFSEGLKKVDDREVKLQLVTEGLKQI